MDQFLGYLSFAKNFWARRSKKREAKSKIEFWDIVTLSFASRFLLRFAQSFFSDTQVNNWWFSLDGLILKTWITGPFSFLQLPISSSFSLKISAALKIEFDFEHTKHAVIWKKIYSAANTQLLRQIRSPGRFSSLQILFWCFKNLSNP